MKHHQDQSPAFKKRETHKLTPNPRVIALCDTDASLKFVDIAIPTNNKSRHSIGLIWYLLCREVLRLRGTIPRGPTGPQGWEVLPDLFFYRDPEEIEREAADKAAAIAAAEGGDVEGAAAGAASGAAQDWDAGNAGEAVFAAQPTDAGMFYHLSIPSTYHLPAL